jgi:type II secretory pathway component PulC
VPVGLRLSGVGAAGPFAALGLRDGDLLLEVSGRSIATPDAALAAYGALRTADRVWLVVERAGERIRTDYVVR